MVWVHASVYHIALGYRHANFAEFVEDFYAVPELVLHVK